jgi:methyl-accepting chemotaxis protein
MLVFLTLGVTPAIIIGLLSLNKAEKSLEKQAYLQLEGVREIKKSQIESLFNDLKSNMDVLEETANSFKSQAINQLSSVNQVKCTQIEDLFKRMENDVDFLAHTKDTEILYNSLAKYHIDIKVGATESFNTTTSAYEKIWNTDGDYLRKFIKDFGYYDAFLICAAHGHVMFTVAKEKDLGSNLKHGPYKNTGLARVWEQAIANNGVAISDFEPYAPSNGQQAAFIATPLKDSTGKTVAVIALQLPHNQIQTIVDQRAGMVESAETYIVGKSNNKTSFRSNMKTIGKGKYVVGYNISNPYIEKVIAGKKVNGIYLDSTGNPVIVTGEPIKLAGLTWGCISKVDLSDVISPTAEGAKQDYFTKYIEDKGFYDLFLIYKNGKVFYTVAKEADFGTNMVDGKYSDSNLGMLVKDVLKTKEFAMTDFKPYAPSNGEPAGFAAKPIVSNGEVDIIVAVQLSTDVIDSIMQQRAGMGKTGETYLVGSDKRMRSNSYLDPDGHSIKASFAGTVERNGVDTEAMDKVLKGETDTKLIKDYNNNWVLSAFTPIKVGDTTWAVIAEIDKAEAFEAVTALQWMTYTVVVIAIIAIVIVSIIFVKLLTKPIHAMMAALLKVADGDLTTKVMIKAKDEIGEMGHALNTTVEKLATVINNIKQAAMQTAAAGEELSGSAQNISAGAQNQASSVEEVSASIEELTASISQVADNAKSANKVASETTQIAEKGNKTVDQSIDGMNLINESSTKISKIIEVISQIANQTNLLALNAAIEAASAGEHGLGFAVVADEVRKLAERSSQAAQEITQLIEESTKRVTEGSKYSEEVGASLSEILSGIEDTATGMSQITQGTAEQSNTATQVSKAIESISAITEENSASAEEMAASAEELSAQAQRMQQLVELFKLSSDQEVNQPVPTSHQVPHSPDKPVTKDYQSNKHLINLESSPVEVAHASNSAEALYHE